MTPTQRKAAIAKAERKAESLLKVLEALNDDQAPSSANLYRGGNDRMLTVRLASQAEQLLEGIKNLAINGQG